MASTENCSPCAKARALRAAKAESRAKAKAAKVEQASKTNAREAYKKPR